MKIEKRENSQKYSPQLRFWHWGNALVILGSLLTVLVNAVLFDGRSSRDFIQKELASAGANVSQEQARAVVHGLEDKVWDIHSYFGYALVILLLYRVVVEIVAKKEQSFFRKLGGSFKRYLSNQAIKSQARYEFGIKLLYFFFYMLLFVMATTGLVIAFHEDMGISKSISHSLKEVHGFCMYPILAFIALHIGGVYIAENRNKRGIVSDMINGGQQIMDDDIK